MLEMMRLKDEDIVITLNSIGDGVISTDANGMVARMNPVAEKMCGWTAEEAEGKALNEIFKL